MTTAVTNTVVDHTTDAGFRTWVAEIITMLFTTLGVTQTADTGQINTSTVTRPGTNTAAGYVIGRFNDTAQATSPIFFKLEFGTGNSAANPAMWLTIGTGSNGSGTLTGPVTGRNGVGNNGAVSSTITAYVTSGCYSAAAGFLGLSWKLGGGGTTASTLGGFAIYRSADSTGAVTTDAAHMLTNAGNNSTGSTNSTYNVAVISYLTSTAYSGAANPFTGTNWMFFPWLPSSTLYSANNQVGLCFQYTPVVGITPWIAPVIQAEWGLNATGSLTIIGSTSHTYKNVGSLCGAGSGVGPQSLSMSTYSMLMLWE